MASYLAAGANGWRRQAFGCGRIPARTVLGLFYKASALHGDLGTGAGRIRAAHEVRRIAAESAQSVTSS